MTGDPPRANNGPLAPGGGSADPAGERRGTPRPGHFPCAICDTPISPDEYPVASCWTDPNTITVAAHDACLRRLGETDLGLR